MANEDLELGHRYFCREETTGKRYCGMFHVDADDMAVELYAFDEHYLGGDFDDLLVLHLANNIILSLHNNIPGSGAVGHNDLENHRWTSRRHVVSNVVIAGDNAWLKGDPVRRISFSINHAEELLRYSDKFEAVVESEFGNMPDGTLFALKADGMMFKAWYPASSNLTFKQATNIGVRYGIEFDEPRDLTSYMPEMLRLVHFVSAAMGHRFAPSGATWRGGQDDREMLGARDAGVASISIDYGEVDGRTIPPSAPARRNRRPRSTICGRADHGSLQGCLSVRPGSSAG